MRFNLKYNPFHQCARIMNTITETKLDKIEVCKKNAAYKAVRDTLKPSDKVIGIGSGSTMRYVLESLKTVCIERNMSIVCIPTSFQSKQLIYDYGMVLGELDSNPKIDLTIDGADEVDSSLVAIKGGGACLTQEKVIASAASKFVVVADHRKNSKDLGENWAKGIPIEVLPMAYNSVRLKLSEMFHCDKENIVLRIGKEKAGPVITDNGNFVLDWKFNFDASRTSSEWQETANSIKLIPGVIETGIFADMIDLAFFGQEDGNVLIRSK